MNVLMLLCNLILSSDTVIRIFTDSDDIDVVVNVLLYLVIDSDSVICEVPTRVYNG